MKNINLKDKSWWLFNKIKNSIKNDMLLDYIMNDSIET